MFTLRSLAQVVALTVVALTVPLAAVHAADLPAQFRFCSIDVPFPPYARVDGTGHLQYLIAQAAKNLNLALERHVAPRKRCIEEMKNGQADGMIAAYAPERTDYAAFPMSGGEPDESMALVVVRYLVYRRTGSHVDWNGQHFAGIGDDAVGVESGFVYLTDRLKQIGVRSDDGAKTLEQNLIKLTTSRVAAVVAMDREANKLAMERFAGRIEPLAKPFDATPMYLMVSKSFQARYPQFTESYWQAIKDFHDTADYRAYQARNP
jgi:polar amino acid transport system substrate-binding protein